MSAKTSTAQDDSKQLDSLPCNFFQCMAISLNVRYCGGVKFPPAPAQKVVSAWFQSVAQHGAHLQLVLLKKEEEGKEEGSGGPRVRPVLTRQKMVPGSKQSLNFATPAVELADNRTLAEIITDNLYGEEELHPSGPARSFLYVNSNNQVEYLVVNVSASIWDSTTTLKSVLESFLGYMHKSAAPTENPYAELGGWETYIQSSIRSVPEPAFLPIGDSDHKSVAITEILSCPATTATTTNTKDRRLTFSIHRDTVVACEKVAKVNSFRNISRLGIAALNRALAEAYFDHDRDTTSTNEEKKVTIAYAIQIDPRTMLPSDVSTKYLNAVGSLSAGRTINETELQQQPSEKENSNWLVNEANVVEEEIAVRLKRGEGARKIMEVVTGEIVQEHYVLAATEWTHHGVYETRTTEFAVELGHRFDKCPQMTVVSYIESASGVMKLEVQTAENQDREATKKVFERTIQLLEQVASTL